MTHAAPSLRLSLITPHKEGAARVIVIGKNVIFKETLIKLNS